MRCFLASWPDEATRTFLDDAAQQAARLYPKARRVPRDNLHLTLAFIGELAVPKAAEAVQALRAAVQEPFEWRIDHVGRFERARVVWVGGQPEPRLVRMAEMVRTQLQSLAIPFDPKPFVPHVTLLRDVRQATERPAQRTADPGGSVQAITPFRWLIREAHLMLSERTPQGATRYRTFEESDPFRIVV